jgi:hypothetical protein
VVWFCVVLCVFGCGLSFTCVWFDMKLGCAYVWFGLAGLDRFAHV